MRLRNPRLPDKNSSQFATAARLFEAPAKLSAILGNERGVALVMALVLGLVGMLMITAILYMVGTGTWTSGSKKRYLTALEASHGGMNFFTKEIIQNGVAGTSLSAMGTYGGLLAPGPDVNFANKLTTTGVYPATPVDATLTLTFQAPTPNIIVNATILSTNRGNSGTSQNVLVGGGVVSNSSGTVTPQHIPYLFQTDIQGQSAVNPRERARLSAVYAY